MLCIIFYVIIFFKWNKLFTIGIKLTPTTVDYRSSWENYLTWIIIFLNVEKLDDILIKCTAFLWQV